MKDITIQEWNVRYRLSERSGQDQPAQPRPLVKYWSDQLAPGKALDLACGTGRNALYLAAKGWKVDAVDGAETATRAEPGELLSYFAGFHIRHYYEGESKDAAHRRRVAENALLRKQNEPLTATRSSIYGTFRVLDCSIGEKDILKQSTPNEVSNVVLAARQKAFLTLRLSSLGAYQHPKFRKSRTTN